MKTIGQKIQSRRKELGITQQELADLAGVGINTLVAIERDQGNPSLKVLQKVAGVIGFSVDLRLLISIRRSTSVS